MKFLFTAPRFHPNFQFQLKALMEGGHRVEFFCLYSFSGENHTFVKPRILGYSKLSRLMFALSTKEDKLTKTRFELNYGFPPVWNFVKQIRHLDPDVIVVKNLANAYSALALVVGRLLKKRLIALMGVEKYRPKLLSKSIHYAGKAFGVKVITPLLGDPQYQNLNKNLFFVPLPHPARTIKSDYFLDGKINILCVGKFSKRKNQMLLLEIVKELSREFEMSLTFVGQKDEIDYLNQLQKYVSEEKLEHIVHFKFDLPLEKMHIEYLNHDVFVLPSYNEQFSFSALEAMSYGLPAICSDDNGIKWYIKNGQNGFIFKSQDKEDLTDKLRTLCANRERIIHMGKIAHESIKENCSLEKYSQSIERILTLK